MRHEMTMVIRKVKPEDNIQLAELIRSCLEAMEVPKEGTAHGDAALDDMYGNYQEPNAIFYVATQSGKVIGCGGIAPLADYGGAVCELQKMYVAEKNRGMGIATTVLEKCLVKAIEFGYESCYLETLPAMEAAQNLYKKMGFVYVDGPMGNTGHHACSVRMLKTF